MEIEQLSVFSSLLPDPTSHCFSDLSFDRKPGVRFKQLPNGGYVYSKIDWLTVMFFNCSMNHVLEWLKIGDCVTDFCLSRYELSRGFEMLFKFNYNGVVLETSQFGFYGRDFDDIAIFDVIVPKIRLELSGSALDFLRSIDVDMDSYRLVVPDLPEGGSYHFTRCDWAFDFVNYAPDFVDCLIDHINTHKLPSERVPLASTKGAISCKVVTGGQKTVYLGSPQSDRMLRCYDKRMQHVDLFTGVYNKSNPYGNPDSWFRIEWQTRNRFANDLVHGVDDHGVPSDFKSILKDIFDRYAFADGRVDNHNKSRPVVDFWLNLFNWEDLEKRIIQNQKYVEFQSPDERAVQSFCNTHIRGFLFAYSILGRDSFFELMNRYLDSLQAPDPQSSRRFVSFLNKLNVLGDSISVNSDSSSGLFNNCGRLSFRW